jgi:hypothetical protein
VAQINEQARSALLNLREGRAAGATAAQALLDSYGALVSGVLIGMGEGMQGQTSAAPSAKPRARRARQG